MLSVSAPREELHRLVDDLPDEAVLAVLADLRVRTEAVLAYLRVETVRTADRPWPPSWFGAARARDPEFSNRVDEILGDELGRRPA